MRKKIKFILFSFTLVLTLALGYPSNTLAKANGGEVQTNGVITFYTESSTTEPTTEPTSEPDKKDPPKTSEPKVAKPVGRYPSTGEMVKTSFVFAGAALVIIGLLLFFWKRKKDQEGRDSK